MIPVDNEEEEVEILELNELVEGKEDAMVRTGGWVDDVERAEESEVEGEKDVDVDDGEDLRRVGGSR